MTSSKLAEQYVEFSAKGVSSVTGGIDAILARMGKLGSVATTAGRTLATGLAIPSGLATGLKGMFDGLAGSLGNVAGLAAKLSGGGGLLIGFFGHGAAQGTVEADQLGKAIERLTRVVGDMFAPYLRIATGLVEQATKWWGSLSEATKSSIAQWLLIGTAIAGVVAILPTVLSIGGAVVGVIAAMVSPIGLVVGGLIALAGWFSGAADAGIDWQERITRAMDFVIKGWGYLSGTMSATWAVIEGLFSNMASLAKGTFNWLYDTVLWFGRNWDKVFKDLFVNTVTLFENLGGFLKRFGESVWDWISSGFDPKKFVFEFGKEFNKLGEGMQRTTEKLPDFIHDELVDPFEKAGQAWADAMEIVDGSRGRAEGIVGGIRRAVDGLKGTLASNAGGFKINAQVGFEGLQGTFDRLQKAFAEQSGSTVQESQLGQLTSINSGIQQMVAGVTLKNQLSAVGP